MAAATLVPALERATRGAFQLGLMLMFLFFVTVGAAADLAALRAHGAGVFAFAAIVVVTHLVVTFPLAAAFGLPMRETVIGSCSNVTGPTVSAGMAANRGWQDLVIPGLLTGILGYIAGNFIGIAVSRFLA